RWRKRFPGYCRRCFRGGGGTTGSAAARRSDAWGPIVAGWALRTRGRMPSPGVGLGMRRGVAWGAARGSGPLFGAAGLELVGIAGEFLFKDLPVMRQTMVGVVQVSAEEPVGIFIDEPDGHLGDA